MSERQKYTQSRVTWRGIDVEIRHCRAWCTLTGISHVEVMSTGRVPLPITETGYRSQFTAPENVAQYGTVESYVLAWLDHSSQSRDWKIRETEARQLFLF